MGMTESMLFAALAVAAPALKDQSKDRDLVGDWVMGSLTVGGETVPPRVDAPTAVFRADGKYYTRGADGHMTLVATYTLDRTIRPMAIDWYPADGQPGDPPKKGIFRVRDDTLTICLAPEPESPRPATLESPKGTHNLVNAFTRAKKKAD